MRIGLDVGSTTLKCVVLDDSDNIIYKSYKRHFAQITESTVALLQTLCDEVPGAKDAVISISGSAGMGMAEASDVGCIVLPTNIFHRIHSSDGIIPHPQIFQ